MKSNNKLFYKRQKSFKKANNFLESLKFALDGIIYCYQNTRNFKIQLSLAFFVLLLSLTFGLNLTEYLIICSTISSVLILEILNTSIESLVDLNVENKFSRLAKISKDCSAAAVLISSINALIVALYIFFPKIMLLLNL